MQTIKIITFFLLVSNFGYSQTAFNHFLENLDSVQKEYIQNNAECKEGVLNAIKDFESSNGQYFAIGDIGQEGQTYMWHMANRLKIKTDFAGCVPDPDQTGYNIYATFKLKELHGADIFEELSMETDSLYQIGLGNAHCEFKPGIVALEKYVYCKLNLPVDVDVYKIDKEKEIIVNANFVVGINGEVRDSIFCHVINATDKKVFEEETFRIFNGMKNWKPAQRNGAKVSSVTFYSIVFDSEKKRESCVD